MWSAQSLLPSPLRPNRPLLPRAAAPFIAFTSLPPAAARRSRPWLWLGLDVVAHWIADESRRRALARELESLNDYYLRDIGIEHKPINEVAERAVAAVTLSRRACV